MIVVAITDFAAAKFAKMLKNTVCIHTLMCTHVHTPLHMVTHALMCTYMRSQNLLQLPVPHSMTLQLLYKWHLPKKLKEEPVLNHMSDGQ